MRGKCYWHVREWGAGDADLYTSEGEGLLTCKWIRGDTAVK